MKKTKAVFLDRDGTIIRSVAELTRPEQLRLLPRAAAAIARFNQRGFQVIVVTNQPIIQKGLISMQEAAALHEVLSKKLAQRGARIDAFYICPHSYPSTCRCRKPAIDLIKQAQEKFNIDLKKSFLIGDSTRDIATGINAGLKTILVKTGEGGKDRRFFDVEANYTIDNLWTAVKIISR